MTEVKEIEPGFLKELSADCHVTNRRHDLSFERKYLFNSSLHLNAEGSHTRTDLLVRDIRRNIFSEAVTLKNLSYKKV